MGQEDTCQEQLAASSVMEIASFAQESGVKTHHMGVTRLVAEMELAGVGLSCHLVPQSRWLDVVAVELRECLGSSQILVQGRRGAVVIAGWMRMVHPIEGQEEHRLHFDMPEDGRPVVLVHCVDWDP